jgi:hypothetical protein
MTDEAGVSDRIVFKHSWDGFPINTPFKRCSPISVGVFFNKHRAKMTESVNLISKSFWINNLG